MKRKIDKTDLSPLGKLPKREEVVGDALVFPDVGVENAGDFGVGEFECRQRIEITGDEIVGPKVEIWVISVAISVGLARLPEVL